MWWRNLTLILALAGCGFTPAYGPGGAGRALFGAVHVQDPDNTDEFAFNARLSERLGPEGDARFDLDYTLKIAVVPQAITTDEVTTRYSLNGTAEYRLIERGANVAILRERVSNFTSYSTTGTTIATLAAERDAHERLMRMLADQVATRLLASPALQKK